MDFAGFPYSVVVLDGTGLKKIDTIRHMNGIGLQVIVVNYQQRQLCRAHVRRGNDKECAHSAPTPLSMHGWVHKKR